jgi:hypothetical protein
MLGVSGHLVTLAAVQILCHSVAVGMCGIVCHLLYVFLFVFPSFVLVRTVEMANPGRPGDFLFQRSPFSKKKVKPKEI